jgi:hypothetical protein
MGTLKTLVYAAPVDNEEALQHCVVDACQIIRTYTSIFEQMRRSLMRRVEACTEPHAGHIEHLLQMCSFSCNPQIECFRTHADMDIFLVLVCGTPDAAQWRKRRSFTAYNRSFELYNPSQ